MFIKQSPVNSGALPILRYLITATPPDNVTSCAPPPCFLCGLVPGRNYTIRVRAVNALGVGNVSLASPQVFLPRA